MPVCSYVIRHYRLLMRVIASHFHVITHVKTFTLSNKRDIRASRWACVWFTSYLWPLPRLVGDLWATLKNLLLVAENLDLKSKGKVHLLQSQSGSRWLAPGDRGRHHSWKLGPVRPKSQIDCRLVPRHRKSVRGGSHDSSVLVGVVGSESHALKNLEMTCPGYKLPRRLQCGRKSLT